MADDPQATMPGLLGALGDAVEPVPAIEPFEHPDSFPPTHHIRSAYDREIAEIKDNILRMGSLVEAQIHAAIDALVAHDADAATRVIIDDRIINELQRKATAMDMEWESFEAGENSDHTYFEQAGVPA